MQLTAQSKCREKGKHCTGLSEAMSTSMVSKSSLLSLPYSSSFVNISTADRGMETVFERSSNSSVKSPFVDIKVAKLHMKRIRKDTKLSSVCRKIGIACFQ